MLSCDLHAVKSNWEGSYWKKDSLFSVTSCTVDVDRKWLMMPCSTASTGACSLPAAAVDSCWTDGPVASLHRPRHPAGAMGMVGECWLSLQGAAALGAFILLTSFSSPACMFGFLSVSPQHITNLQTPLLLLHHHREPSCPEASLMLRPLWGCLSSRRPVATVPSIPSPTGQPRLSPPWAAQVSKRQTGTRGGLQITWPPPADSLRQDVKLMSPQACN